MRIRPADQDDLKQIVEIYFMDPIVGDHHPTSIEIDDTYKKTFSQIDDDPNQLLLVAEDEGAIIGTVQVTCIQYLLGRLIKTAVVEALFVHPDHLNDGIGTLLMGKAEEWAKKNNCYSIRLTTNKKRTEAHRFYERLDFVEDHLAFKKIIE
jgi:GNAT superfamily N-acetyltransferase